MSKLERTLQRLRKEVDDLRRQRSDAPPLDEYLTAYGRACFRLRADFLTRIRGDEPIPTDADALRDEETLQRWEEVHGSLEGDEPHEDAIEKLMEIVNRSARNRPERENED